MIYVKILAEEEGWFVLDNDSDPSASAVLRTILR